MGYGQNLKDILDNKGMTVKELALKAKIAPTTLYSIIQRNTAIRFDTALRIHLHNVWLLCYTLTFANHRPLTPVFCHRYAKIQNRQRC